MNPNNEILLLYDAFMNQGGKFSDCQNDYEDLMDFLKKLVPTKNELKMDSCSCDTKEELHD